ncbi:MAG: hypothetical protein AB1634_03300 [Thermodesulfobacteriota bacterium]
MTQPIRLRAVEVSGEEPSRLNLFAGRHLGEREFDLLQAYADDRLAPLLATALPGIYSGLEVATSGVGADWRLVVRPGTALASHRVPVSLFSPLVVDWPTLTAEYARDERLPADALPPDGLYFLVLARAVEVVDEAASAEPCRRTEEDPTRDLRLETVARLGLAAIPGTESLLAMPQARAVNRLLARYLLPVEDEAAFPAPPLFVAIPGAIPVAILAVKDGRPRWLDSHARLAPRADGRQRALAEHAQAVLARVAPPADGRRYRLRALLGLDYLPAAGRLPAWLLGNAGSLDLGPDDLAFDPVDLQVEVLAVPASTAPSIVEGELARSPIDLVHGQGDRLRLLLAVSDPDYRPDLMDLPLPDFQLEAEVYALGDEARRTYGLWQAEYDRLFAGLGGPGYEEELRAVARPRPIAAPETPAQFFAALLARHEAAARDDEPLALHLLFSRYQDEAGRPRIPGQAPAGHADPALPPAPSDRLYCQRTDLGRRIAFLEQELADNATLMADFDTFLQLQRQHLDNLTLSFSHLAGGVPGDGSGLKLTRWLPYATFERE